MKTAIGLSLQSAGGLVQRPVYIRVFCASLRGGERI